MKLSQFNTFFPQDGKIISYNSFSDKFLVLDHMLHDMIGSAKAQNNFGELNEVHPAFYNALVENGFLVEEELDEVQRVREFSRTVDWSDRHYHLTINPTMNCNFKCWYCYESHIKNSKMSDETIERVKKHISHVVNDNARLESFTLSWFGGEPLLFYDPVIEPILKHAREVADNRGINLNIAFTTNGLLITDKMIERFLHHRVNHFQITLDGYREQHDLIRFVSPTRGSYFEIIENIKKLCRTKAFSITIRINYTKVNLPDVEKIGEDLADLTEEERKCATFSFHKVWQEEAQLDDVAFGKIDTLADDGFRATSNLIPNNVRDSCYADKRNSATINYNGDIHKCTARDFAEENRVGVLNEEGFIDWNEKFEHRMNIKFRNRPCMECRILPMCGGGCSQHALEFEGEDYCMYHFDESTKTELVMKKFEKTLQAV